MAHQEGLDPRKAALESFNEANDLALRAHKALQEILKLSPRAIMFVYETDDALRITTVPFSKALAKGLADAAYEMMWPVMEVEEEEE